MDEFVTNVGAADFRIFTGLLKTSKGADGRMRLHGVASSTTRDLHGDVMTPSAIEDMQNAANNNLTIYLNHSYEVPEDVAGSVERAHSKIVGVDHEGNPNVDLLLDIVVNDANPRAIQAFEAIDRGTKLGLSIGATIPEGGAKRTKGGAYVIDHVNLLETSIVGIPANPRSWVEYAAKSLRSKEAPVLTIGDITSVTSNSTYPREAWEIAIEPSVTESVEPDVTDATVTVETPFANVTVNTSDEPASQEAESAPETEVLDETADGDDAALGDSTTRSADISQSLTESLDLALQSTRELVEVRAQLLEAQTARSVAERERDAARTERDRVLAETLQILNRVANAPLMRRAVVRTAKQDFRARLEGVYSDELLKMLERNDNA